MRNPLDRSAPRSDPRHAATPSTLILIVACISSRSTRYTEAYLAGILARIHDHDPAKLDDLLPWNWSAQQSARAQAA